MVAQAGWRLVLLCAALAVAGAAGAAGAGAAERGTGIKVGAGGSRLEAPSRGGGLKLGADTSRRARPTPPAARAPRPPSTLSAALVVPHKAFGTRDYIKAEKAALAQLQRKLKFFGQGIRLNITLSLQELTPSPMSILDSLCKEFLAANVSAILYLMNHEQYGRSTASAQYFLQLAGYLGIPVTTTYLSMFLDSLCKEFLAANVSAILYLMNHEQYGRSTASAQYFLQLAGYLGIPVTITYLSMFLDSLCKEFLAANVSAILYLMNHEQYGRSTASAQYFLQLAGYLGIPVTITYLSMFLDSLCKEFLAANVSAILYLMNHEQYGRSTASAQYFLQLAGYLGIPVTITYLSMFLDSLCKEFLAANVSAILYLMNHEQYGRSTASAQYFLQLAGYLGIPVIAWNADNSGLERRASHTSLRLQLAPSIEHQTAAMLSILERYKWHQFSVVTSPIAGHDDFIQAVREKVTALQDHFKFTILNAVVVKSPGDLGALVASESRVMLLYATREEAAEILSWARDRHITGENYVWIVTQSVIGTKQPAHQFPVGMLGVHFDTSSSSLIGEIASAIKVFAYGVESYVSATENAHHPLGTRLSCAGIGEARWSAGERFFRHLRNVTVEGEAGRPNVEFTADGELKAAELKIMNLRPGVGDQLVWEEIGAWKSYRKDQLDIKDIVWPGGSHTPPQGVPEKFHMRITFLEEPPYINLAPPDPVSGRCSLDRGVICRVAPDTDVANVEMGPDQRNSSVFQCCSGFCIDLLQQLAEQLGFTYELVRVEDGKWGTQHNGKWNGLIAELVNKKTDMVLTSLIINSDREAVVDFSVPYMETGVAIVVAKRTGIISPTAFLEPFDTASWMLVGAVAIQAATFSIFLFEWLSPSGFDMSIQRDGQKNVGPHRFSLCRTYWIVWAVLFQASVHVDSPRGFTARFMTNMWAMFAVVFLAIYTANLAAFMITREEFHELSGLDDPRIARPLSHRPTLRFGTVPWSHSDATLSKYFPEPHAYMKQYNRSTVSAGVTSVLTAELDAFIYDGTVLDYLVSQDEDCRLLTVGSWYAMSGYGLAFVRNSKYLQMFNKRLLDLRANGDLERLRRYWMTGTCKPNKQEHKSSDPLALEQFLSAFLLLMAGILLAALLLAMEHVYFRYMRAHLATSAAGPCCALVSLSMGQSLTFRGAVMEAQWRRRGRCRAAACAAALWRLRHERDGARARAAQLAAALAAHGLPLPPRRLASAVALLHTPHDATRPRTLRPLLPLLPPLSYPHLPDLDRPLSCSDLRRERTRVEMETVL